MATPQDESASDLSITALAITALAITALTITALAGKGLLRGSQLAAACVPTPDKAVLKSSEATFKTANYIDSSPDRFQNES
jgi:hypothetical protein